MPEIGQKIIQARKAKGMTQEELAASLNVSRSTISNWEAGRRLPDVMTLMKLSALLECWFDGEEAATETGTTGELEGEPTAPEQAAQGTTAPEAPATETKTAKGLHRWKKTAIWAAAILLVLCAVLIPVLKNRPRIAPYTAADGKQYMPADFRSGTETEADRPNLKATTVTQVIASEGTDLIQYEFIFNEDHGFAFDITNAEIVVFGTKGSNKAFPFAAETLAQSGVGDRIEAKGKWSIMGGLPKQEGLLGAGILLTGKDEKGEPLQFKAFQDF